MRVLMINVVCGIKSTGRICVDLAAELEKQGHEVKIAYGRETVPEQYQRYAVRIGNNISEKVNALSCRLFDNDGFAAKVQTKKFLKWANEFDPKMLWLHNLHGYYLNIEMLFKWIKSRPKMKVKWTLHDCWPFTGHCVHFSYVNCSKWLDGCSKCTQKNRYPKSMLLDQSKKNYRKKEEALTGIENLTLITPSKWLADLTRHSILKEYPVVVRNNQIDTKVFNPTPSDFREKYGLQNKKIILGVASTWSQRKGLDDFIELSTMLDESYAIVLVGLSKKQIKQLPQKVIGIERMHLDIELAKIYSSADIFFNPTYEDSYPTVNLEAKACGLPIITYNTGGSPESAGENAIVVEPGDFNHIKASIIQLTRE